MLVLDRSRPAETVRVSKSQLVNLRWDLYRDLIKNELLLVNHIISINCGHFC